MAARPIFAILTLGSALALLAPDAVPDASRRRLPDRLLASLDGQNDEDRTLTGNTDCSDKQGFEGGVSMSDCWNGDEEHADERCFICENDNPQIDASPEGTGAKRVEDGAINCIGPMFHGRCLDPDGNGEYSCVPVDQNADGNCGGDLPNFVLQNTPTPPG